MISRHKMCVRKVSFTHEAKAQAVADKFKQRIYECPICFCWHTTTLSDWKDEFVRKDYMLRELATQVNAARAELNEKNRKLSQELFEAHKEIKRLKALVKAS